MPTTLEVTLPKKFNWQKANAEAVRETRAKMKSYWPRSANRTTRGWTTVRRPRFQVTVKPTAEALAVAKLKMSGPRKSLQIWHWISDGTKSYPIMPKNAPYLAFRAGGKAGSRPGVLISHAAKRGTGNWVRTKKVQHPGIKARNWRENLLNRGLAKLTEYYNAALKKAIRRQKYNV